MLVKTTRATDFSQLQSADRPLHSTEGCSCLAAHALLDDVYRSSYKPTILLRACDKNGRRTIIAERATLSYKRGNKSRSTTKISKNMDDVH